MSEKKHTPGINADRLLVLMGEGQDGFHVVAKHLDKEGCGDLDAVFFLRETPLRTAALDMAETLKFYANPEIYKPHPHGIAFDRRDLSSIARAALAKAGVE